MRRIKKYGILFNEMIHTTIQHITKMDVASWFADCCFEASGLAYPSCKSGGFGGNYANP